MSKVIKGHETRTELSGFAAVPVEELFNSVYTDLSEDIESSPNLDDLIGDEEVAMRAGEVLAQAEVQASEILASAHQQAEAILANARENGYHAGFASGVDDGRRSLVQEQEEQVGQLQQWIEQATTLAGHRVKSMGPILTNLTMEAVRILLQRELVQEPANIGKLVESLLEYVIEATRVEVRVHPADFSAATSSHPTWRAMKFGEWNITVVPDYRIEHGGCEIRSDIGRVDATIQTKLELMNTALADAMAQTVSVDVDE